MLLLWSCAFAAFAAEPAARASAARTEITTVVQNFVAAWNQNNTETLTSLFTPNGTFTSPRGAKGTYTLKGVNVMFGIEVSPEGTFTFQLTRRSDAWRIASARLFKN